MSRLKKWLQCFRVVNVLVLVLLGGPVIFAIAAVEAPTGFDQTNGLVDQATFELDRDVFEEREFIADGLGPLYNAQACSECHQNPVTGSSSQISEFRVARFDPFFGIYSNSPGGSLINDRAIDARIQERITSTDNVRTFRMSLNTLGDGFIEAISNTTLQNIQAAQPSTLRGTIINVPVLEAGGALRIGRFGWKNQHASLVSFSADAYLNEMGITSPLQATENTSYGVSVAAFDTVADPEDDGADVEIFARFMRATMAPPRDPSANSADALAGQSLFTSIGCSQCHTASITTAPAGTVINGGAFVVPAALGDKIIHPYSDFLMHDVGTGDGIIQNGGSGTRNQIRTPPLWGLRSRVRLMHDGATTLRHEAILRHGGQATSVINSYRNLSVTQQNQIGSFLNSL